MKTCLIISGPTAVGKTSLAIDLAKHFSTSIISADSRQCYKELSIGVARPTVSELNEVPHYFIATHSIHDDVNVKTFEQYALEKADEIFANNEYLVMVGGTGLYIQAFAEGIDTMPDVPETIRQQVRADYKEHGLAWLQHTLSESDPVYYKSGEIKNPARLMRALEVSLSTGKSILDFQQKKPVKRPFRMIKIGLKTEKEILHNNISSRVERMIEQGLVDEAKSLIEYRHLKALQTVGYTEMFSYLEGGITLQAATEEIKKNTRHYAKRQMTWFSKHKDIQWFDPLDTKESILRYIDWRNTCQS